MNMGTAAHPVIRGKTHYFSGTGVYHAMAIFRDAETGSFWEHATGECIQGPLQGAQLKIIPAQYILVEQVLAETPSTLLVTAKQSWIQRLLSSLMLKDMLTPEAKLPAPFRVTLGELDPRLPEMQLGLGIWIHGKARFYSIPTLKAHNSALIDTLNQENLAVFVDPIAQVPVAHRCSATSCTWDGDTLVLNTGERIRNGYVQTPDSSKRKIDPPEQQFVRWYAFSYKFPNCEIYDFHT